MTTKTSAKKAGTKKVTGTKSKTNIKSKEVTENVVRKKAQEIYNKRILKGVPGNAESDWLQAERELLK